METNISGAYENKAIVNVRKRLLVLELLLLKMEVTVSEPCDVIRVQSYKGYIGFQSDTCSCVYRYKTSHNHD